MVGAASVTPSHSEKGSEEGGMKAQRGSPGPGPYDHGLMVTTAPQARGACVHREHSRSDGELLLLALLQLS